MKLRKGWLAVVTAGAISLTHANNLKVVYYDISARTGRGLIHEMGARGPLGQDGRRYPANTRWHVALHYLVQPIPGGCKLIDFTVTVEGTMTLPRWIDSNAAPRSLVRSWDAMAAAMRVHESGHYAHGIEAAREIGALREAFPRAADCRALDKEIDGNARAILDKYAALDAQYDRDTKHGQTQGAILYIDK
jgi:predicted secreted Zn-dependent protease